VQIPELPEPTPEQRRARVVVLAALAIGGVTFFGVVFGLPGGGGSDEPSQTVAAKSGPNTDAILAAEKRRAERLEERAERRAIRRRKKANTEWKKLKEQYDAMKSGTGADPGADQPSQGSTPAPAQSSPTPQPTTPQTPAEPPPAATTPQPTTPAQPAGGGSGDPRYYGIP
jgi:hypothetical protein